MWLLCFGTINNVNLRPYIDVMTKTKINQKLKSKLSSSDTKEVLSAIEIIREKGNKDYLPVLFDLLASNPEHEVRKEILKLFGTIKVKETVPYFIDALKNDNFNSIRKDILTTCWQNGLDFSPYIEVFIDLIVSGNWEVAFEAFTVIENLEYFPLEEKIKNIKLKIAGVLKNADEQKTYFLEEILKLTP